MPSSKGQRNKTRDLFKRPFRAKGTIHLSTYLRTIKLGDYVDVKGNGAIHKGLPHKYYHGRTGIVWNISPRAVGVIVNKQVRNRIIPKRIHVRVEHVQKSRSREDFLKRVKENEVKRLEAKKTGKHLSIKRTPALPRSKPIIVKTKGAEVETLHPMPYADLF